MKNGSDNTNMKVQHIQTILILLMTKAYFTVIVKDNVPAKVDRYRPSCLPNVAPIEQQTDMYVQS
jgi:hypothetical protein